MWCTGCPSLLGKNYHVFSQKKLLEGWQHQKGGSIDIYHLNHFVLVPIVQIYANCGQGIDEELGNDLIDRFWIQYHRVAACVVLCWRLC